jgi:hypothetical protein
MRNLRIILTVFSFVFSVCGFAQNHDGLFTDDYRISPEDEGEIRVSVDNISFFRDNEFFKDMTKSSTLPGFRLNPRFVFQPLSNIRLEAGLSMLKFWGADIYPNHAYLDIATWNTENYSVGFHALPFFRAQIQPVKQLNIVLGTLYGGGNHGIIEPLYNSELNLSADPETGAQILFDSRVAHIDVWLNWESFIFNKAPNIESMTAGFSSKFHITNPKSKFYLGIPVQILSSHQGGEINTVVDDADSKANGATGVNAKYRFNHQLFKYVETNIMGVGAKNLRVKSEPDGWGVFADVNFQIKDINVKFDFWRSGNFLNLFGSPMFGNVSTAHNKYTCPEENGHTHGDNSVNYYGNLKFMPLNVFNPGIRYEKQFGKGYHLGASFDCMYLPDITIFGSKKPIKENIVCWSGGIYFRINPEIVLSGKSKK